MLSICYNLIVKRISERDNMSKEESNDISEMSYEELIASKESNNGQMVQKQLLHKKYVENMG